MSENGKHVEPTEIIAVRTWRHRAGFFRDTGLIAAVAVAGKANDWTAYIGAAHASLGESQALDNIARMGAKLSESEARGLFFELADSPLIYRG